LVVHFACDNKFAVLARSAVKKINLKEDTCQVHYDGIGWCEGTIWRICKDEKSAIHKMKKYMKSGRETTDDEGASQTAKGSKRKLLLSIEEEEKAKDAKLILEDEEDEDEYPPRQPSSVSSLHLRSVLNTQHLKVYLC
jgi:hypothetical protein